VRSGCSHQPVRVSSWLQVGNLWASMVCDVMTQMPGPVGSAGSGAQEAAAACVAYAGMSAFASDFGALLAGLAAAPEQQRAEMQAYLQANRMHACRKLLAAREAGLGAGAGAGGQPGGRQAGTVARTSGAAVETQAHPCDAGAAASARAGCCLAAPLNACASMSCMQPAGGTQYPPGACPPSQAPPASKLPRLLLQVLPQPPQSSPPSHSRRPSHSRSLLQLQARLPAAAPHPARCACARATCC